MRKIICLFILVICFVSCNKENHVYFFYDGGSKDTTISIKFLDKKAFEIRPRVKIVLKDSIYGKNSIEDLFGNTDFKHLLESEKSINVCDFFLYKEEESFSDFELYTDSNYYLKGHVVFLENGKPLLSLLFENSYLRDKILKREQREREIKDSIKRDSIIKARRQNQMELAFMGYELGKSYSNSKGEKKKLVHPTFRVIFV